MLTPNRTTELEAQKKAVSHIVNADAVFMAVINKRTGKLEMYAYAGPDCINPEEFTELVSELKLTCYKHIEAAQKKNFGEVQLNAVPKPKP